MLIIVQAGNMLPVACCMSASLRGKGQAMRKFVRLAMVCLSALLAGVAWAYPTKPPSIIVPPAPGGANDVLARMVAGKLSEYWGMPVLVDFKPGGGVIVATQFVARSAPDG